MRERKEGRYLKAGLSVHESSLRLDINVPRNGAVVLGCQQTCERAE